MLPEQPLTIAQACRVLGVSERTLRRILRQPEMQAQMLAEHRRTATGLRRSSLLPPHLIQLIKYDVLQSQKHTQYTVANTGTLSESSTLAYERLLAEQAARIADLQASLLLERERVAQLTAALKEAQRTLPTAQSHRKQEPLQEPLTVWQRLRGRRT